jgi:hypothetical protein
VSNFTFLINFREKKVEINDSVVLLKSEDYFEYEKHYFINVELAANLLNAEYKICMNEMSIKFTGKSKFPFEVLFDRELNGKNNVDKNYNKITIYSKPENMIDGFTADWNLVSSKYFSNRNYNLFGNTKFGSRIFYGDFNSDLFLNNKEKMFNHNNNYSWRYYFENSSFLRQFIVGDFYSANMDQNSLYGIKITNTMPYSKKIFDNSKIDLNENDSGKDEVQINNETFLPERGDSNLITIPFSLRYGANIIKINRIDEYGALIEKSELIFVPNEMLKKNDFEYSLSTGRLKYYNYKIIDVSGSYGLNNNFTTSAGLNYIDISNNLKYYPFINFYYRLLESLIINSEIRINHRNGIKFNYYNQNNINTEIGYNNYASHSFFNTIGLRNELFANLNLPFRIREFRFGLNLNSRMQKYVNSGKYSYLMNNIYLNFKGINLNFVIISTSSGNIYNQYRYTNYSFRTSLSFIPGLYVSLQSEYSNFYHKISDLNGYLNKRLFKNCDLSFDFRRNFLSKSSEYSLSLRWNFSTMNLQTNLYEGNGSFMNIQGFGNISYNTESQNFLFNQNSMINRGSACFTPFIDVNGNSVFDPDEFTTEGLPNILSDKGEIQKHNDVQYLSNLDGYEETSIAIEQTNPPSFSKSNIRYIFSPKPNLFNHYYIPFKPISEITGNIRKSEVFKSMKQKIHLQLVDTLTKEAFFPEIFSNGDFRFKNIKNGNYYILLDSIKINNILYLPNPKKIFVEVENKEIFKIFEDNDFVFIENLVPVNKNFAVVNDSIKKTEVVVTDSVNLKSANLLWRVKDISLSAVRNPDHLLISYLILTSEYLKLNKNYKILIEGYTDNSGEFMDKFRRTLVIINITKSLLKKHGIPDNKILSYPFLDSKPLFSNLTQKGREKNNRVVLRISFSK